MTKSSTVWAVAGGTVVTLCVAGGGLVGLTRALEAQPTTMSTLTTSHGVTTKSAGSVPAKSSAPEAPTTPAPSSDDTPAQALGASDPTVVPPAAPKFLDVPTSHGMKWAEGRWSDHNGDAHRWMHRHTRSDHESRADRGDPTPQPRMAPATEAPARMAPMQQRSDQQSQERHSAPSPRHRSNHPGDQGPRGHHDGGYGGHHRGGSHGGHR